jgi:hypothetical protein
MSTDGDNEHPILASLAQAIKRWLERSDSRPLAHWVGRELDSEGVPVRLLIPEWHECLKLLAEVKRRRRPWPEGCEGRITGLILASLRFSRPDGGPATHSGQPDGGGTTARTWGEWASWCRGTGIARVLGWWFPGGRREHAPPPLPAWASRDRVLAILRADWLVTGDFVALDHRNGRIPCRFELFGTGRAWLGPDWSWGNGARPATNPRLRQWITGPAADLIEWSDRALETRVTRTALLLRGRRLALVSVLAESSAPAGLSAPVRWAVQREIAAAPLEKTRGLILTADGAQGSAQVIPLGLPCLAYPTDRGWLKHEGGELVLSQAPGAGSRRLWLPLLVSWDPARRRKSVHWRILTVSERSRAVRSDRAFAARVSWGRNETYVVYRSLGPAAPRAFLGHQTSARFLFGEFTTDGTVTPLLTVD